MGMYTELFISTKVKDDSTVVAIIKKMLDSDEPMPNLPYHPLFSAARWHYMLQCNSYYFVPRTVNLFEHDKISGSWVLISRSDFKNYDDEVNLFWDWIAPYLDVAPGDMVGYSRYEENTNPIIHYQPVLPHVEG